MTPTDFSSGGTIFFRTGGFATVAATRVVAGVGVVDAGLLVVAAVLVVSLAAGFAAVVPADLLAESFAVAFVAVVVAGFLAAVDVVGFDVVVVAGFFVVLVVGVFDDCADRASDTVATSVAALNHILHRMWDVLGFRTGEPEQPG
jgi:hypothetical protein